MVWCVMVCVGRCRWVNVGRAAKLIKINKTYLLKTNKKYAEPATAYKEKDNSITQVQMLDKAVKKSNSQRNTYKSGQHNWYTTKYGSKSTVGHVI